MPVLVVVSLLPFTSILPGRADCPFCPENSHMTPEPVYACSRVRVIPNKYPAFTPGAGAYGFHEVLIDTPDHEERLHHFTLEDRTALLLAVQNRMDHYYKDGRISYIQVIKNDGAGAGASICHSHWQLFALDFIPGHQRVIHKNLSRYQERTGGCFLCDIKNSAGLLTITENADFLAYSPYASLYTHMVQVIPKAHISDYRYFTHQQLTALSALLKPLIQALEILNPGLSYNICMQNTPYHCKEEALAHGHFYLQIIPRIGNLAGFEFSTGCFINSVKPEVSCGQLKSTINKLKGDSR